jgi:ABC-type transport system involved in cytochrome bd biosynthesis fused ATPase/permease subunit
VLDELASISVALVAVPLGLRLLNGTVSLAAALAVLIVAPEVFLPLRRASAEFHQSAEGLAAVGSVMNLIDDAGVEGCERGAGVTSPPDPGRVPVELCSIHLALPGRPLPILDGAELTIHPAETVVMVGANGAGKSTILSLLLAFSAPTSGALRVGGHDLRSLDHEAWRERIAYLPEHPSLLDGTLADNLRLADPSAGDEQLVAALAAAGAPELLDQLDEGLSTRIGDGGRPVSAGERQRIGLARIMLRPASLYLLDEPTVHLDVDTEAVVVEQLRRTLAGRSALIVTHRSAVLTLADRVVTLADGRVVAMNGAPGGVGTRSLPIQGGGPGAIGVPEVLGARA